MTNTAVSRAVGEAMILAAHGEAAATVTLPIEERALGPGAAAGMVATAKCLAGEGASGAGLTVVEGGAKAWHWFLRKWKRPPFGRPFQAWIGRGL